MPSLEKIIYIKGDRKDVFELAKVMEDYPNFMPNLHSVKVLERSPNRTVSEWKAYVEDKYIEWTEEDIFDDDNTIIKFNLVGGDLDKFEGEWRFEEKDGGTNVVLTIEYEFGMPTLERLIGPTLHMKLEENIDLMLKYMKEKVEGK